MSEIAKNIKSDLDNLEPKLPVPWESIATVLSLAMALTMILSSGNEVEEELKAINDVSVWADQHREEWAEG